MDLEILHLPLFQRALVLSALVSILCGVVGTYIVVKRMASMSGGLSHAAFGGIGLGYFAGFSPLLGATIFCVACAVVTGFVYRMLHHAVDTLVAVLWSFGMAVGMLLIALTPGYAPELSTYLFGSILFAPAELIPLTVLLDIAVVGIAWLVFRELQAVAFDEEFSEVVGLPVGLIYTALLVVVAFTVVVLIRIAGVILTISLLTTPALIARQWARSLEQMMLVASIVTAVSLAAGLFASVLLSDVYSVDVPTGPLVIIITTTLYGMSSLVAAFRSRGALS